MVISSDPKDLSWKPRLFLQGKQVKVVTDYKFLGVTIDQKLRFNVHVNRIIHKARKRIGVLRCLKGKEWGQDLETLRTLYITYIRSAVEYASQAWYPWISNTQMKRLERIQSEALRVVTGHSKTCSKDFLCWDARVKPLKERMKDNCKLTWERFNRLKESDGRRRLAGRSNIIRLTTRKGWRNLATIESSKYATYNKKVERMLVPPWNKPNIEIQRVKLNKRKDEYTTEQLKDLTNEKIMEI